MPSIFKAYDIRGVYPSELNIDTMYRIGAAFANRFKVKRVLVGYDMRTSSEPLFNALTTALMDQGIEVFNIGLTTTPMMYFTTAKFGFDAGIMVTASHNPPKYNGAKMVAKGGVPIGGETGIYDLEKILKRNFRHAKKLGHFSEFKGAKEAYINKELGVVKLDELMPLKVVVDTGNGMGGIIARDLFSKTRLEMTYLCEALDGTFPNHEANPIKDENIRDVVKEVKKQKAAMGIAFDGDADRVVLIDETGEKVPSDLLGAALATEALKKHKGGLVLANVTCSQVVKEEVKRLKGRFAECKVGHSLIKAQMRKQKAIFAIEFSGHFFLKDNYYLESPFAVALMVLHRMSKESKSLSEIIKPYRKYFATGELNFEVKDKDRVIAAIAKSMKGRAKKISRLDGLKMEFADFWFNVRPSNTEPLLRLNLEAKTAKRREEMRKKLVALIKHG